MTRREGRTWRRRAGTARGGLLTLAIVTACGEQTPPTAPENPGPPPVPLTLVRTPSGTGVQWGTRFIFDVAGTLPATPTFTWRFGDNAFAEGPGPASHVYSAAGDYMATLEVRSAGLIAATVSTPVSVRSLLGTWHGTVTGHTDVPRGRPAITSFTLTVFTPPNPADRITPFGSTVAIDGLWTDNTGCRVGRGAGGFPGFLVQTLDTTQILGFDPSAVVVSLGIEQFECNGVDGFRDFPMLGTADAAFNVVNGTCSLGGPECRFEMRRQ